MAETITFETVGGRDLSFCEWGDADGSPLFYLHGTPGSRFLRAVNGEYERNGLRVITYDRPGYGGSARRRGRTVRDAAEDVQAITDHLGIDGFAVVGVSGGGPHALAVAAALSDQVTRCVTICGLAPCDASDLDFFEGMDPEEISDWDAAVLGEEHNEGRSYRETLAWLESLKLSAEFAVHERDMLVAAFTEAIASGPGGMFDDYAALSRPWGFDVTTVVCPVTVMVAEADTSVPPAHGRWLANRLPQARLVCVPGGHFGPRCEEEEKALVWASQGGHH